MTATYYLSSLESTRLKPVRSCTVTDSLVFDSGKPAVRAQIDPPIIGQDFNRGTDIDSVYLAARHEGVTVDPVSEFPCFVFVAIAVDDRVLASPIRTDDLEIIGWGELYRTHHDAEHHVFK